MHIQLLSDIHLEVERTPSSDGEGDIYKFDFPADPHADALALLGDIGMTIDERLFVWLRVQLARFKLVFFVAGNHEPYWSSMNESQQRLVQFAKESEAAAVDGSTLPLGRFILLDRTRYDVSPTLTILGCTLWAALDPDELDILRWSVTDFGRISTFTPDDFVRAHNRDVRWLTDALTQLAYEEPKRKVIIMTHHAPTKKGTSDPKLAERGSLTNSAFATELVGGPCWNAELVKVWMFGHTHWNCDFEREGIRVVSNQRGYRDGARGFEPVKVIKVGTPSDVSMLSSSTTAQDIHLLYGQTLAKERLHVSVSASGKNNEAHAATPAESSDEEDTRGKGGRGAAANVFTVH